MNITHIYTFIDIPEAPWVNILIWLGLILAIVIVFCIIIICITKTFNFSPKGLLISLLKIGKAIVPGMGGIDIEKILDDKDKKKKEKENLSE